MIGGPHAPAPSVWPVTLALGIATASAGVMTHWLLIVSGATLAIIAIAGWVAGAVGAED